MLRSGCLCVVVLALVPLRDAVADDAFTFFEQRIRPVLVKHCYECHSAGAKALKGGLMVDSRPGLLAGGDSGPAVVPGNPDDSPLIQALRHEGYEMPPTGKLDGRIIADFETWVRQGAPDPRVEAPPVARPASSVDLETGRKFWSFVPPRLPDVPHVRAAAWPASDVDRFILARLEAQGVAPSPDADRATWLRRATFDLTGLPPTAAELADFASDTSPEAFAKVVDRLLASPRYGERWGRYWLDVARFAESSGGGRSLMFPDAWRYRDYVIASFNADKPFDQFVREQLAGDLLPAASVEQAREQLVATAFWMLGPNNYEEQDKNALEMDIVDEQLDTMGRALLGMTIGCARCHDHKFDPIPTRDYYALAGILQSTQLLFNKTDNVARWLERPLPLPADEDRRWQADVAAAEAMEKRLDGLKREASKRFAKANRSPDKGALAPADLPGIVLDDVQGKQIGTWLESRLIAPFIGQGYLHDDGQNKGQMTLTFVPEFKQAGTYEVRLAYTAHENRAANVPIEVLSLEGEGSAVVDERKPPPIDGRFVAIGRFRFDGTNQWYVRVSNEGTVGSVVVDAVQFLPVEQIAAAADARPVSPEEQALRGEIADLERQLKPIRARIEARPKVMAVQDQPTVADCAICIRGNINQRGETVPRGFLQVAWAGPPPVLPSTSSGRRELAEWITAPAHPLTARVLVNRVWQHLFGAGLVRTVDNFGHTGEPASHPELLDYLARRFVEQGWSVKRLTRELILTHAYRQSSAARTELTKVDPDNLLLGRMNRRRLDAEALRDAILAVSGKLDLAMGGPTIGESKSGAGEYGYVFNDVRRSVYTPVFRNRLLELFETFDFADPNTAIGQRNTSTVAPQALFMLNSPFVIEQSGHAAARLLAQSAALDGQRLDDLYLSALARRPTERERQLMLATLWGPQDRAAAWERVCQAVFGCLDFRYLD